MKLYVHRIKNYQIVVRVLAFLLFQQNIILINTWLERRGSGYFCKANYLFILIDLLR